MKKLNQRRNELAFLIVLMLGVDAVHAAANPAPNAEPTAGLSQSARSRTTHSARHQAAMRLKQANNLDMKAGNAQPVSGGKK